VWLGTIEQHDLSRTDMADTSTIPLTYHSWIEADGMKVFYREAGPANAPVILLHHGFLPLLVSTGG
jgi:hypothetical protein